MRLPSISFGLDVRQPSRLETRSSGAVLLGIRDGGWRHQVQHVRELPSDSPEQRQAKLALPFAMFAGVFSHRSNNGLLTHAGQVGIDLDGLGEAEAVAVIQKAVADRYCLAAFRSTRGEGVRLIFKIPPCSPEQHRDVFEQVSVHVRNTYGHEPDPSGKDVARASFVSFDSGLWLNLQAEVMPLDLPRFTQRLNISYRCVNSPCSGTLANASWECLGRLHATTVMRDGGKTHRSIVQLGKAVALHGYRTQEKVTPRVRDAAFDAWRHEIQKSGTEVRGSDAEYRRELELSIEGCEGKPWFKAAAEKWIRWARHADFPANAIDRILFAIRQHCKEANSPKFFIGARDAALVGSVSAVMAARILRKLCAEGFLEKLPEPKNPRHAFEYKLLKP